MHWPPSGAGVEEEAVEKEGSIDEAALDTVTGVFCQLGHGASCSWTQEPTVGFSHTGGF